MFLCNSYKNVSVGREASQMYNNMVTQLKYNYEEVKATVDIISKPQLSQGIKGCQIILHLLTFDPFQLDHHQINNN